MDEMRVDTVVEHAVVIGDCRPVIKPVGHQIAIEIEVQMGLTGRADREELRRERDGDRTDRDRCILRRTRERDGCRIPG